MGTRRKLEPLKTFTEGGGVEIDYGIYSARSSTGDLANAEFVPSDPVGHVEWLAVQIENQAQVGDKETKQAAANALVIVRRFLANRPSQDAARGFLDGWAFGRLSEKVKVLPHQPAALAGKRQAQRNARTAKARQLTASQLRERWQAVQDELVAQARHGRRISREQAYQAIAERMNLSKRAIKQSCIDWEKRQR